MFLERVELKLHLFKHTSNMLLLIILFSVIDCEACCQFVVRSFLAYTYFLYGLSCINIFLS